jgi:hypothetical protein
MASIFHPDKARFNKAMDLDHASQIWQQLVRLVVKSTATMPIRVSCVCVRSLQM